MKFRSLALTLAAATATLLPALTVGETAVAATTTTVTAGPSTTDPAPGFQVPITGTVSGPATRPIVLVQHVEDGWKVVATGQTHNHRFQLWYLMPNDTGTYRVIAPKAGTAGDAASSTFKLTPSLDTKPVKTVNHRSCEKVSPKHWKLGFTLTLKSGERTRLDNMILSPFPYIGILTSSYGASYNVVTDFTDIC